MTELQQQLQQTLGSGYAIERELGGGGMSRVFVARETALDRRVVVKILPPDLSASVSAERFRREIQLAAGLQHPHIVPVLTAGISEGLPYFTMPFVDGESLRARLLREHELTVNDTVAILRDVAKALAYAHARGVVHRDIKPDNVLLTGGSAVVTDFGVAKALRASQQEAGSGLTSLGMAMGTPAYMAPEQAAADPDTDARADIYALGVVAYEMVTGRPVFSGRSPQQVLAAHTMQTPTPVTELRPSLPPAFAALIMRCLQKHPADRPQTAEALLHELDTLATPTGVSVPAMTAATRAFLAPAGRVRFGRALGVYAIASIIVVALAALLVQTVGVPDWVLPGVAIVMALGLPMVLITGYVQRRAAATATMSGSGAHHVFTWRRTAMGGAGALGAFTVITITWLVMRHLGIGPAGSLMAAGKLRDREQILVTDFRSPPSDTMLGSVVTSALRTDLSQSSAVSVVQPTRVSATLARMQKPANSRLDLTLAREVAQRDGVKAVLDGDVTAVGPTYVLSVHLFSADSGIELAAFRESADDQKGIIPAVDRLSKKLRGRIGESLKTVRDAKPLEQVTTPSLDALRKYALADHAITYEGDNQKGIRLLQEAIALDSGFAMAYRKLGVVLGNTNAPPEQRNAALQRAYDNRERLTDWERYLTIGTYYMSGPVPDPTKALSAYESLIDLQPENYPALNNASLLLARRGEYRRAAEYDRRAITSDSSAATAYTNLAFAQYELGDPRSAHGTIDALAARGPGNPAVGEMRVSMLLADDSYDSAKAVIQNWTKSYGVDVSQQVGAENAYEVIARARGQLVEAARHATTAAALDKQRGFSNAELGRELSFVLYDAWYRGQRERAAQRLDAALAKYPLASLPPYQRPYVFVAILYAVTGRPDRGRAVLAQQARDLPPDVLRSAQYDRHSALGEIALAEGKPEAALDEFRQSDEGGCPICTLPSVGRAFDHEGKPDSAIATFEKYLATPSIVHGNLDPVYRAGIYLRLGELYQARGDTSRAASNYARFIAAWQDADPDLQPKVDDAKRRLKSLARVEKGS